MVWNSVKRQLRSVIEWKDPSSDQLFVRWTENGDEIKNASKLIVGPGQACIFVYEGKVMGVHEDPGMYDIKTANIPFITTLSKFMQGFTSEHKVGIYFYRNADVLNLRWGTTSPVKYQDPQYKFPVGLRAHGNFSMRIANAVNFFTNVVASRESYSTEDLRQVFVSRLAQPIRDYLASGKYSFIEIDSQLEEISAGLLSLVNTVLENLGFVLKDFRIEGTSFDDETMARVNRIADATADAGAAKELGVSYVQMQQLAALRDAARNEGGIAGLGAGLGAGLSVGQVMGEGFAQNMGGTEAQKSPAERLKLLKELFDSKLISEDDFNKKKAELLSLM